MSKLKVLLPFIIIYVIGVAFLVGICNAGPSLFNLDKMMKDGVLQNTTAQLVMGLTFLYVGIILIVKQQLDKREM